MLNNFYNNKIAEIAENKQLFARKMIEEGLITESERRRSAEENDLIKQYSLDIDTLNRLVESRLLRKEPRLDSHYYEISHDTLVQPILISYKSRKAEEDAAHQAQELARLKAEQAKQEAALAEEKRRADEQERLRKRATLFAWGAGILAVVALIAGGIAKNKMEAAEKATETAKNDNINRVLKEKEAIRYAKEAEIAKDEAVCAKEEQIIKDNIAKSQIEEKVKQALAEKKRAEESLKAFHEAEYKALKNKVKAYESIGDTGIANQQKKLAEYYYKQHQKYISEK